MWPWLVSAFLLAALGAALVYWRRAAAARDAALSEAARLERARQESLQQAAHLDALNRALRNVQPDPVLLVSPERQIVGANEAARALFGGLVQPGQTVIAATRSVELEALADHLLAGGDDDDRQVTLNGLPYRARAARAETDSGALAGVVVALHGLSELQRLGRARRDFIANISHELRTPLTSIRLLLDNYLRDPALTQPGPMAQAVGAQVRGLEQLAQELLDLAEIESGQTVARLVPVDLAGLVQEVVLRLGPQSAHKQQSVTVEVAPGLLALADADQISRALGNLLHNAIKFTPEQGQVWVRARAEGEDILVEVADSGPGIAPADVPRVFERFFRGDRSRRGGGTGLGLAIARHVIGAHGGRIWVESEGRPGRGAVFRFTLLPAAAA